MLIFRHPISICGDGTRRRGREQERPLTAQTPDTPGFRLEGEALLQDRRLFGPLRLDLPVGWTCLLGVSGAGKSTILRLLAGLPTGTEFRGSCHVPHRIAYMTQADHLQPRLTAVENVLLAQRLRGLTPDRPRALDLLRAVGLADLADRRPAQLSGGQRQRVALARALIEDAPLALLDEPFSALDAVNRRRMQELSRETLRGRAVLLVTHDPVEALRLGDRVVVLRGGTLRALPGPLPLDFGAEGFDTAHERLLAALPEEAPA